MMIIQNNLNPEQFVSTGNEESCMYSPVARGSSWVELACKPESTRRSHTEGSFLIPPPPPAALRRQRVPVPAPSAAAPRCASLAAASPPAGDGHDKPRPLFPPPKFPFLSFCGRYRCCTLLVQVSQIHPAGPGSISPFVG